MVVTVFIFGPSNPPGRKDAPRFADMANSQPREKAIAQKLAAKLYLVRRKNTNGNGMAVGRRLGRIFPRDRVGCPHPLESRDGGAR
jgi:hypothetical protein